MGQNLAKLSVAISKSRPNSIDPLNLSSPPAAQSDDARSLPDESTLWTPPPASASPPPTSQQTYLQSTSHLSHPSVRTSQSETSPPPSSNDQTCAPPQDSAIIPYAQQEAELTRYALRMRQPKQLNPYIYDKAVYKHQMRSHPDAIVKIVSPRRGSGQREEDRDVQTQTQEEWDIYQDQEDDDDWRERTRRKRVGSTHLGDGSVEVEFGKDVDKKWYPKLLDGNSSSDEDHAELKELRKEVNRARKREEKAKSDRADREKVERSKRPKPFPVGASLLTKWDSPEMHKERSQPQKVSYFFCR
jgi:hypothetical protein